MVPPTAVIIPFLKHFKGTSRGVLVIHHYYAGVFVFEINMSVSPLRESMEPLKTPPRTKRVFPPPRRDESEELPIAKNVQSPSEINELENSTLSPTQVFNPITPEKSKVYPRRPITPVTPVNDLVEYPKTTQHGRCCPKRALDISFAESSSAKSLRLLTGSWSAREGKEGGFHLFPLTKRNQSTMLGSQCSPEPQSSIYSTRLSLPELNTVDKHSHSCENKQDSCETAVSFSVSELSDSEESSSDGELSEEVRYVKIGDRRLVLKHSALSSLTLAGAVDVCECWYRNSLEICSRPPARTFRFDTVKAGHSRSSPLEKIVDYGPSTQETGPSFMKRAAQAFLK